MQIWRSLDEVPGRPRPHRRRRSATSTASTSGTSTSSAGPARWPRDLGDLPVVAVTFDPHPMAVLRPEHAPPTLTTLESRAALLAAAGVDDVLVVVPFDREMAAWSPERFVERRAGRGAARPRRRGRRQLPVRHPRPPATWHADRSSGASHGFEAVGDRARRRPAGLVLDVRPDLPGRRRRGGRRRGAGPPLHRARGRGQRGDQRGRELGYPTANVPTGTQGRRARRRRVRRLAAPPRRPRAAPCCPAAISVGTNPTFDGERDRRVESYVLDRDDLDLYDVEVEVSFVARIRGMVRFDSVEDARRRPWGSDVEQARERLRDPAGR